MRLIFRKRIKFGPIVWNFSKHGFTSWGLELGPWSWNSRTRAYRVDLPGPFSWSSKGKSSPFMAWFMITLMGSGLAGILSIVTYMWIW